MSYICNHLRLLVHLQPPWMHTINGTDCKGIHCNLLTYLSLSLNFTYNFIVESEGLGIVSANGSWTGALGILQRDVRKIIELLSVIMSQK